MNGIRGSFVPGRTGTGDVTVLVDDPVGPVRGTDVEELYRWYGTDFVHRLDADCAVAVVDRRKEPTLVLASTGRGTRPLHYAWDAGAGAWLFAGILTELLDRVPPPAEEETALDAALTMGAPFGRWTPHRGIESVPPASAVVIARPGEVARTVGPLRSAPGTGEAPEPVRAVDEDPGDPSATALIVRDPMLALAAGLLGTGQGRHLFTPVRGGGIPPQLPRLPGVTHHHVEIGPADFPGLLTSVTGTVGLPHADPELSVTLGMLRAAAGAGFTRVVSGDGVGAVLSAAPRVSRALRAPAGLHWVGPYLDELAPVPRAIRRSLYTREYALLLRSHEATPPADFMARLTEDEGPRARRIAAIETGSVLPTRFDRPLVALAASVGATVRTPLWTPEWLWTTSGPRTPSAAEPLGGADAFPGSLPMPGRPLWTMVRDVLSPAAIHADGRLRTDTVAALLEEQELRPRESLARVILALTTYQIWRQHFRSDRRSL
ncbi:asparagine synthase-related protein [Streptomyces sp. NPDC002431]